MKQPLVWLIVWLVMELYGSFVEDYWINCHETVAALQKPEIYRNKYTQRFSANVNYLAMSSFKYDKFFQIQNFQANWQ